MTAALRHILDNLQSGLDERYVAALHAIEVGDSSVEDHIMNVYYFANGISSVSYELTRFSNGPYEALKNEGFTKLSDLRNELEEKKNKKK